MAKPKILILGGEEPKSAIKNAGFEICDPFNVDPNYSAIIIDLTSSHSQFAKDIIDKIGKTGPTRVLTFAWVDENHTIDDYKNYLNLGFDGAFNINTPLEFIKARLLSANRIRIMASEAKIRFHTLESLEPRRFDVDIKDDKPLRVLIYGQASPFTLKITTMLDSLNILSVASISSFTAFDYLHRGNFDAIIIITQDDRSGVTSFCSGLRRNSRLYHLPCLVFANQDFDNLEDLMQKGASDVSYMGLNDELTIARLLTLIDEKRRREKLAISFAMTRTSKVADAATGLYNELFFKTHINELMLNAQRNNVYFSLGFVNVSPNNNGKLDLSIAQMRKILSQTGSMISRLIRTEDSACSLEGDIFAIILPSTNSQEALIALNRICAVIETSAFNTSDNQSCMVITNKWHKEISKDDDLGQVLEIAKNFLSNQI